MDGGVDPVCGRGWGCCRGSRLRWTERWCGRRPRAVRRSRASNLKSVASRASVAVSIAELESGIFSAMFRVNSVRRSTWLGRTSERAGFNRTSSKESASLNRSSESMTPRAIRGFPEASTRSGFKNIRKSSRTVQRASSESSASSKLCPKRLPATFSQS